MKLPRKLAVLLVLCIALVTVQSEVKATTDWWPGCSVYDCGQGPSCVQWECSTANGNQFFCELGANYCYQRCGSTFSTMCFDTWDPMQFACWCS